jgi:hypothetical protein
MTSSNPADVVTYFVVVEGLDPEAQQITMRHFQTKRAGARSHDLSLYVSVPANLGKIEDCLSWARDTLPGRFQGAYVMAHVESSLNWVEFMVPPQLLDAASRYGATVKVFFATRSRTPMATVSTES